jgi:hypothetical protein
MPLWDYIVIDFYDFPLTLGVSIVTLGMGIGACRRSKDSMPSPVWDNAARTKKIPKGYILWETHVWVGSAGIWISHGGECIYFWPRALLLCASARALRTPEECVSGPLSSSMNDRDRSGLMVREKDRTDLFKVQARWHFYLCVYGSRKQPTESSKRLICWYLNYSTWHYL